MNRNKKTPEQEEVENKVIAHALAAFCDASDYEPGMRYLNIKVTRQRLTEPFEVEIFNDAFRREIKPINAITHFLDVESIRGYQHLSADSSISQETKDVKVDGVPLLYDPQEFLDIFDEAVERCAQRIAKSGNQQDSIRATLFKATAGELKFELRRQFMEGAQV